MVGWLRCSFGVSEHVGAWRTRNYRGLCRGELRRMVPELGSDCPVSKLHPLSAIHITNRGSKQHALSRISRPASHRHHQDDDFVSHLTLQQPSSIAKVQRLGPSTVTSLLPSCIENARFPLVGRSRNPFQVQEHSRRTGTILMLSRNTAVPQKRYLEIPRLRDGIYLSYYLMLWRRW